MELSGMWGSFYRISVVISKMAYVNLLWIAFTLVGFVVLGVAPATVALFTITRDWAKKDWDQPVFKTFWQTYREEFWRANGAGIAFFAIGFLLYWNFTLFAGAGVVMLIVRGLLLIITVLFGCMLVLFFPTYVSFHLKGLHRVRAALLIACGHPYHLILIAVSLFILQSIFMFIPGLILFFAAASVAYIISWISHRIFEAMKQKQLSHNEAPQHG
ncbi:hypothetical protein AJ85_08610 [Alkalihalobacillus alcalophilus ATCC 27647 = CGMCC 1.3604]|uniref:DUF624 domain-containing protein n=1 Tax=Alkalihalobacillus alcalophilus ATCC 27647 = CGMCC 1.3604 TaxID=1218173 RepID=A0A094WI21_ALKAL|nr:DUF624 domain-containing protein [Alkalihalobacillus alcalophilus]KGA97439.1 hypothetical protein BALCAV_0210190 [Alkalihalobacillus alcalophilus ATCC 27647 = CGMCC 1.3604]MED1562241.1 DUF624 domain-containing protein [Alkalihalobacillus alcalophilus]THG90827.1 hypothetical protein AJ85_08610 [Alkalihalobacillus alcalophilus ATCC 27647 = CGMCC 1.3604]